MDPFSKIKKMKTLLIDDDELIRDSFRLAFSQKGCFLMAVETAEEGLCVLQNNKFDIIISDFTLPGMNGIDFFKQVAINQTDTANVLISGNISPEKLLEKNEAKVHDFVQKEGGKLDGLKTKHHEIYLSDPRKANPATMKTVIRQPFK